MTHIPLLSDIRRMAFCLFAALLVTACGTPGDRFRLEGRFKNLNQGEFYLYNLEQGRKDTLKVNDGKFFFDIALSDTVTFVLMFPNYSELPVFAQPGAKVTIVGDVSHLKETEVKGTRDNEEMTAFRLKTNEMMPPEVRQQAELFITDQPQSPIGCYLLRRYFIQGVAPDYPKAYELCDLLLQAQPTNVPLVQLHQQLAALKDLRPDGTLPAFKATDTNGKTVDNSLLTGRVNVIMTWASWNYDSQFALRQIRKLEKAHPKELKVITICLDATPADGRRTLESDSITWPNVCDGQMWSSPAIMQLALTSVPDNIVTDGNGQILARSLTSDNLKNKIESLLK